MLRLIICLYLAFASTVARASLQDLANEMSARRESQRAAIAAQAPLVEKAWSCNAIFHPEKVVGWKFRQNREDGKLETVSEGRARLFKALVEFRGCPDKEDSDQIRKAFIDKYICDWNNWNGHFQEHKQMSEEIPEIIKGVKFCSFNSLPSTTDYESDLRFHQYRNEKFKREQEMKLKKS